jgi:hypothetical protein
MHHNYMLQAACACGHRAERAAAHVHARTPLTQIMPPIERPNSWSCFGSKSCACACPCLSSSAWCIAITTDRTGWRWMCQCPPSQAADTGRMDVKKTTHRKRHRRRPRTSCPTGGGAGGQGGSGEMHCSVGQYVSVHIDISPPSISFFSAAGTPVSMSYQPAGAFPSSNFLTRTGAA